MSFSDMSFPRYIYQQAATPTGAVEGALWYNTTTNVLSTFDGATWNSLESDVVGLERGFLEIAIAVIYLEANATITHQDYLKMFVDKFSDSDGYDNTINTGNTTSFYDTDNKVYNNLAAGSDVTDAHSKNMTGSGSTSNLSGIRINPNFNITLTKVTKHTGSTATKCYIRASLGGGNLASATFSGDDATFNIDLDNATEYWIVCDAEGGSYTRRFLSSQAFPETDTNLDWVGGVDNGSDSNAVYAEVLSVVTGIPVEANTFIETNSFTIPSGITAYQLFCNNSLAGSGAITFDFSANNGGNYDTGKALNSKITFSSTTGTTAILKINLNGIGSGNSSEASDYALMIWT